MPSIHANGLDVAYLDAGSGPPLIALHGAGGGGTDRVAGLVPSLAERFRVIAPDARGHAGTRGGDDRLRTEDLARDVLALADGLALPAFHLLGYSMGGMTALHVATTAPQRIQSLVLLSIATEREPRLTVARRLLDPDRIARDDAPWAAQLAARHDPGREPGAWRRLVAAIVADIAEQPLLAPAALRSIDAPALVVVGDRDPLVPVSEAHALARQVRDGRLLVVPDAGHDVPLTQPALVRLALTTFFTATAGVAAARAGARLGSEVRA